MPVGGGVGELLGVVEGEVGEGEGFFGGEVFVAEEEEMVEGEEELVDGGFGVVELDLEGGEGGEGGRGGRVGVEEGFLEGVGDEGFGGGFAEFTEVEQGAGEAREEELGLLGGEGVGGAREQEVEEGVDAL